MKKEDYIKRLTQVSTIENDLERGSALFDCALNFPVELLEDLIEPVQELDDVFYRVITLRKIAERLPEQKKNLVYSSAVLHLRNLDDRERERNLEKIIRGMPLYINLPDELSANLLEIAETIPDTRKQIKFFIELGKRSSLAVTHMGELEIRERERGLNKIIQGMPPDKDLPEELLASLLSITETIPDSRKQIKIFMEIVEHSPDKTKVKILHNALEKIIHIGEDEEKLYLLLSIKPELEGDDSILAEEEIGRIKDLYTNDWYIKIVEEVASKKESLERNESNGAQIGGNVEYYVGRDLLAGDETTDAPPPKKKG